MGKGSIPRLRLWLVIAVILSAFGGGIGRLYYLHIHDVERLERIVASNRSRSEILYSRRGNIIDAQGNLLATTQLVREVGVDPQHTQPADISKLPELAALLQIPLIEIQPYFTDASGWRRKSVRWKKLARGVDEDTHKKIMALKIKGVYGNRTFERIYPARSLAAHVLGFINRDNLPVMGVERDMDFYLRGQNGWRESERDGHRREIAHFRSREVAPTDGLNVELTLDQMIQNIIEEELQSIVAEYQPESASIIVSDPSTGYILGLANFPTFDPNLFLKFDVATHRNRAITDTFEPGSAFKIVPISAALNERLVSPDDTYDCTINEVSYNGRRLRLPRDHRPFGVLSIRDIVIRSSNRGAAYIGTLLGAQRLYDYCKNFGFGAPTGYGSNAEVSGVLHPIKKWDGLTVTRLPIGHAVSATPFQLHYAMSVIANRGVLMQPRIVRRVFKRDQETIITFKPIPRRRVITTRVAETMTQLLRGVVGSEGTARAANLPEFAIAGKTGTTQKLVEGRYSSEHHIASFVGFFPANRPEILITVVVNEPQNEGVGYAGFVAAPAFRRVAKQVIQYRGIQPENEQKRAFVFKGL